MSKYEIGAELTADRLEDPTFIHSNVDDLGLNVFEFRVYCHLKRRANAGVAWPGFGSIAKVCCISRSSVIRALKGLEARQMIAVTRREHENKEHERNLYHLTKASDWKDTSVLQTFPSAPQTPPLVSGEHHPLVSDGHPKVIHNEGSPLKGTLRGLKNLSATRNGSSKHLLSEEEFLSSLKEKNPDLDVDLEWRKLHTWCLAHPGKQPTRARFANWIIRADRSLKAPKRSESVL